ncbi:MAG: hypothetical protein DWQ36_25375 [Acidobacteria bacterium]|nr:MAG: hypothetical protein DWQ30_25390 [Acidobacteriota bacterium]REJ99490.1 MAG: hypothetical protein DWQ36_25375 [Acidobacteriota bacterium]
MALAGAYLLLAATWAALALHGAGYYLTDWGERARHPGYWDLKPGGRLGLLYGYIGAAMMTVLLVYSLRKRVKALRRLGTLSKWLDWHILLGVFGPLFVVLHSSLKVGGLVSIAFWSMLTVALSGVFGRFLYLQIPRSRSGQALSLDEIEQRRGELEAELRENAGEPAEAERWLAGLDDLVERSVRREVSLPRLAVSLPVQVVRSRLAARRLTRSWDVAPVLRRRVARLAVAQVALRRRMLLLERLQRLFFCWHVFHKPFAVILYCLMVVHVAVAWATGYRGPLG